MKIAKKKTTRKQSSKLTFSSLLILIAVSLGVYLTNGEFGNGNSPQFFDWLLEKFEPQPSYEQLADVGDYVAGPQEIEINNNHPVFTAEELSLAEGSWESYSPLDRSGRVGVANAMLGTELLPTEKREPLTIDPTGWNQLQLGENQWLYNRSHLIGFQLTGENNNEENLMTGTRSLNTPYMLAYENDLIYYIKETGHHVRYRVTPYFKERELVARGVQLEAESIEDDVISFNVFIYNIQEGIEINYQTGVAKKVA
ncbi:DNA-entry nuclease [Enterococcus sp. PF1-24]|uniref:DNA/RNA non-specific endonuclease n=1 Tax=unclassified Enterococcus TaxID=2608891 RepID=UPI002474FB48|nr:MULTISPECIES: DNA/RNA non-specific endonuclease [unclassified Enterococcus]MDH6364715.1 DNA-entry nuclease [Enterococcus sp. PFB1-1]MDH6401809.1 DNA-entry nuclease [Enterococcus sp. PF1-24]